MTSHTTESAASERRRHAYPPPRPLRGFDPAGGPPSLVPRLCWALWRWRYAHGSIRVVTCGPRGDPLGGSVPDLMGMGEAAYLAAALDKGGIGVIAGPASGVFGATIEGCIDREGLLSPAGRRFLALIRTYAEVSPSERGITVVGGRGDVQGAAAIGPERLKIYAAGEVIPITGWHMPGTPHDIVTECPDAPRGVGELES